MNARTEAPYSTLDRSMLHGKRSEAAKRKALGMGISPRALGGLRRRGLISGCGELELGLPGTATTSDVERRRFLLEILRRGNGREMDDIGPGRRRTREHEAVEATATYWNREEGLRRLRQWKAVREDGKGDWRRIGL